MTSHSHNKAQERRREVRRYAIGLAGAALLTAAAFAVIALAPWGLWPKLGTVAALAILQVMWQFHYFLHIDFRRSHRDDLQLVLFTFLIMATMIGGTLWIIRSLAVRMGM